MSDKQQLRFKARMLMTQSRPVEAMALLQSLLAGFDRYNPVLMLDLAEAAFAAKQFVQAKNVLEELQQHNPGYESQSGHLLYARSLAVLNRFDDARHEYQALLKYFDGLEAKCRYANLLIKIGDKGMAQQLYNDVLDKADNETEYFRAQNKRWIALAQQQLAAINTFR